MCPLVIEPPASPSLSAGSKCTETVSPELLAGSLQISSVLFTALSRHPKLSFWRIVTQPMAKSFLAMHRILAACWNIWNHSLLVSPWQPRGSCLSCPVDESSMAGSVASTNSSGESLQGTNHPVFPEGCTNHSVLPQQFTAHSLHLFAITSSKFQQATLG